MSENTPRNTPGRFAIRWLVALAAAALIGTVLAPAGVASADEATSPDEVGIAARPGFQLPFPCGQSWSGQTRTNHSPAYSIDFNRSGDSGDPVVASAPGTVSKVGNTGGTSYGRYVYIDHGGGWQTRYAHLNSQTVSTGDSVGYGTKIGTVGSTGGSTGPHLHFEQRLNGNDVTIYFNGSKAYYWGSRTYKSANTCHNPYSPEDVCGSGYDRIDYATLSGGAGRVYLMYNGSNGYNCVATIKWENAGKATSTKAYLEVQGSTRTTDSGNFAYYAGPVKKHAANKCVKWGGAVGSAGYASPFEHCGS